MSKEVYLDCKVEKVKDEKMVQFDKLDFGEVFMCGNNAMMKIEPTAVTDAAAVYLDGTGCVDFIQKKELVTRVKSARLYVKV